MTTINHSTGTITPAVVDGYTARRSSGTLIHDIIGRTIPDVTLRPAGPRTGELRCIFATRVAAQSAFDVFSTPQVLALFDPDVPNVNMTFVVGVGDLSIELDSLTRRVWIVTVPYVEVAA